MNNTITDEMWAYFDDYYEYSGHYHPQDPRAIIETTSVYDSSLKFIDPGKFDYLYEEEK